MGKDQELLQAVKTEDLLTVQKLLQRPRPGKASKSILLNALAKGLQTTKERCDPPADDFARPVVR